MARVKRRVGHKLNITRMPELVVVVARSKFDPERIFVIEKNTNILGFSIKFGETIKKERSGYDERFGAGPQNKFTSVVSTVLSN